MTNSEMDDCKNSEEIRDGGSWLVLVIQLASSSLITPGGRGTVLQCGAPGGDMNSSTMHTRHGHTASLTTPWFPGEEIFESVVALIWNLSVLMGAILQAVGQCTAHNEIHILADCSSITALLRSGLKGQL